jgi:hypothetical protein
MRRVRRSRAASPPGERGAAAVEFALVMPLLFALLFGIIDYGVYFADALSIRQATGEAARLAATRTATDAWGTASACTHGWTPDHPEMHTEELQALACTVQESAGALSGQVYVKVRVVTGESLSAATPVDAISAPNWRRGNAIRICVIQIHQSLTHLTPVPDRVLARADMPIEDAEPEGSISLSGGEQQLPDGQTWPTVPDELTGTTDWC